MAAAAKKKPKKKTSKRELGRVLTAVELLGQRFGGFEQRFGGLEQRFDALEAQQHRFGIKLENVETQQLVLAESLTSFRAEMARKLEELEGRLNARFEVVEQAIRELSAGVRKNSEDILKNSGDILKNSESLTVLREEVRAVRAELERLKAEPRPTWEEFRALEKRVTELESKLDAPSN